MSTVQLTIWGVIGALVVFVLIGAALFVQALRGDRRAEGSRQDPADRGFRAGIRRYIGPVRREHALLNAPLRVGLEFVCASCGVPGMGWMMSTRVAIGLPLMAIVPSFVYGFYPVYLAMSGHILDSPYIAVRYLPVLGVASAVLLAIVERRSLRRA